MYMLVREAAERQTQLNIENKNIQSELNKH